jgi:hypothetical protein
LSGEVEAGRGDGDSDDRVDAGGEDPGVAFLRLDFLGRSHLGRGIAVEMDVAVVCQAKLSALSTYIVLDVHSTLPTRVKNPMRAQSLSRPGVPKAPEGSHTWQTKFESHRSQRVASLDGDRLDPERVDWSMPTRRRGSQTEFSGGRPDDRHWQEKSS